MLGNLLIDDGVGGKFYIPADRQVVLGRAGDIVIGDDDEFMHRRLLQFWPNADQWQMDNIGSRTVVKVVPARPEFAEMTVGPGRSAFIPSGHWYVVFSTQSCTYELQVKVEGPGLTKVRPVLPQDGAVATQGVLDLNFEQIELLSVLTRKLWQRPGAGDEDIPVVAEIAAELGWTEKKTNSKIENLSAQISRTNLALTKPYRVSLARYAYERGLGRESAAD